MTRLDDIARRWAKATPGPWGEDDGFVFCRPLADARTAAVIAKIDGKPYDESALHLNAFVCTTEQRHETSDADAEAIAAAPDDVSWLIERVRELETGLEDACDSMDALIHLDQESTAGENAAESATLLVARLRSLLPKAGEG